MISGSIRGLGGSDFVVIRTCRPKWLRAVFIGVLGTALIAAEGGALTLPESWPSTSAEQGRLRDKAIAVAALTAIAPNSAHLEFAESIPRNASDDVIRFLSFVIESGAWNNSMPGSAKVPAALIAAYLRASPRHALLDLLRPGIGEAIISDILDGINADDVQNREAIAKRFDNIDGNLNEAKDALWIYGVSQALVGKYEAKFRVDSLVRNPAGANDFRRYLHFVLTRASGLPLSLDEGRYFLGKYGRSPKFLVQFLGNQLVRDRNMIPLIKEVVGAIIASKPDVTHESALFAILCHLQIDAMDAELVALIEMVAKRGYALPESITVAELSDQIGVGERVIMNRTTANSLLTRLKAGKGK